MPLPAFNVVDGVSLALMPGETLGLVGESGSGKTTLARAMLGLTPIAEGRIVFEGKEVTSPADFRAMRRSSAMMFQDPVASLSPRLRVGRCSPSRSSSRACRFPTAAPRPGRMLAQVGLPGSFVDRFPHELSGGQARRVGVARALAMRPHLLLADEPTAGLDVSVQGDVLNLIQELKRELGFAAMIITHNLAMIRHVGDRLAIMYLGRLVETGPTQAVFAAPLHPYTATLIASEPVPDPRAAPRRPGHPRRDSERVPAAFRLRVPHALPDRPRPLPQRGAQGALDVAGDRMVHCHFPLQPGGQEQEAFQRASANRRGERHDQMEHRPA